LILFRCAKRSILPNKAETCSQNLHWSFFRPAKAAETNAKFLWSKFCSTKSQNSINFLGVLFLVFFEQSDKTFTAAFWMELEFYFACGKILLTEKGRYAFSDQQPKTFFLFPLCKV